MRYFAGFLTGMILSLGIYTGLIAYAAGGAPTYTTLQVLEWNRKKRAAAADLIGPRILPIGGSNVLYGVSAQQIAETTGLGSVNLGTHGAWHRRFHLENARELLREGDLAVLLFEFIHYTDRPISNLYGDYLLRGEPRFLRSLGLDDQARWFFGADIGTALQRRFQPEKTARDLQAEVRRTVERNLNASGDFRDHHRNHRTPEEQARFDRLTPMPFLERGLWPSREAWKDFADFRAWCDANGVRVVAGFPSTVDFRDYDPATVSRVEERIREGFERIGIPVVGSLRDSLFPKEEFFDTVYHLDEAGMTRRTARLLESLRPHLQRAEPKTGERQQQGERK